jgi:hypothetical protein
MAVKRHFLTIPLYDVMTVVAPGSRAANALNANATYLREPGLQALLQAGE